MFESLAEAIESVVSDFLSDSEVPTILTGFALVLETVQATEDAMTVLSLCAPDDQPANRTLGLIAYGEEWVRDDIRRSFAEALGE